MGVKSLTRPSAKPPQHKLLYDQDFAVWTQQTARLLRAGRFTEIDIESLAEEVEDMGKRDRDEAHSRLRVLLAHLLKWQQQPEKRSRSWRSTIATQRVELGQVFRRSPSMMRVLDESLAEIYFDAVEQAAIETGLPADSFPRDCPFSVQQILDRAFPGGD